MLFPLDSIGYFVAKMTQTCKSTVLHAIRQKKWWNTINIEETLEVISRLEIAEQTTDIWHNVRFTHNSECTIHDNCDRIKESAKSETEVLV